MAELDDLRRKLSAREGVPGYKENAAAIKARIVEIGTNMADEAAKRADAKIAAAK